MTFSALQLNLSLSLSLPFAPLFSFSFPLAFDYPNVRANVCVCVCVCRTGQRRRRSAPAYIIHHLTLFLLFPRNPFAGILRDPHTHTPIQLRFRSSSTNFISCHLYVFNYSAQVMRLECNDTERLNIQGFINTSDRARTLLKTRQRR